MSFYLLDNKNRSATVRSDGQYWGRPNRRQFPRVIVLHTSENLPDMVGVDSGAESVASYLTRSTRAASYHWVNDSDSGIDLLPWKTHEAYGAMYGFNQFSVHLSMATMAGSWNKVTPEFRAQIGLRAAVKAAEIALEAGIPRVLITRSQALAGASGFLAHGHIDPGRRYDPGFSDTEWAQWLQTVDQIAKSGEEKESTEMIYAMTPIKASFNGRHLFWSCTPEGKVTAFNDAPHLGDITTFGLKLASPIVAFVPYRDLDDNVPGYWLIASDGGIFNFGDAPYPKSHPSFMREVSPQLAKPIVFADLKLNSLILCSLDGGTFEFPIG